MIRPFFPTLALAMISAGCEPSPPASPPSSEKPAPAKSKISNRTATAPDEPVAARADAAQLPDLSPNAPADAPVGIDIRAGLEAYHKALAPYVEQARQSYPGAKERYIKGLPPGYTFYAVTRLKDEQQLEEQVFIAVTTINGDRISGRIANDISTVSGYKAGDAHDFPESELIDWVITSPDGTEEGNVVGKLIDEWQQKALEQQDQ